jgi:hypothetical protein
VELVVHATPRANTALAALAEASRGDANITSKRRIRKNKEKKEKQKWQLKNTTGRLSLGHQAGTGRFEQGAQV